MTEKNPSATTQPPPGQELTLARCVLSAAQLSAHMFERELSAAQFERAAELLLERPEISLTGLSWADIAEIESLAQQRAAHLASLVPKKSAEPTAPSMRKVDHWPQHGVRGGDERRSRDERRSGAERRRSSERPNGSKRRSGDERLKRSKRGSRGSRGGRRNRNKPF